jgi:hypothetical protein
MTPEEAGRKADELIAAEVSIQDKMWGVSNDRADATHGQMRQAAMAQLDFVQRRTREPYRKESVLVEISADFFYPKDWDGFRSYGSNVANLAVAAAYIRSEMKRLIAAGEDTTRTKRGEPYRTAQPHMSSEEAAKS